MNLAFWKSGATQSTLEQAVQIINAIAAEDFGHSAQVEAPETLQPLMQALQQLQTSGRERQSKAKAQQAADIAKQQQQQRFDTALQTVSACMMIADVDCNIVYMNPAAQQMMQEVEADLRKVYPQLDAKRLIGANIDQFHKNPAHNRRMLAGLQRPHKASFEIGGRVMEFVANPIFDQAGNRLGTSVEWHERTQALKIEKFNLQLITALENASTVIMMADNTGLIINLNKAAKQFFQERESELRKHIANFDAQQLIGTAFARINQASNLQADYLESLTEQSKATVKFGELTLVLIASPIIDTQGKRLGTVLEWTDRTAQLAFDAEISKVIDRILKGKLSTRMESALIPASSGDYHETAEGINLVLDAMVKPLTVSAEYMGRIALGDIPAKITDKYSGDFERIKSNINTCIDAIHALIDDTNKLAQAASAGLVETRADASMHQGDFRRIIEGINATLETIVAPILTVKGATDSINTAAKEIASGNADLSQRTEEQAASLEETASSMEQLSSTVKQNAENAKQANQMALAASDVASQGGEVVQQVIETMSDIKESARKIVDIISVIDGIAFQTNILALNAAVEAARAGEQGRGFAVVAGEVRSLAQRSAAAAKEIKSLIGNSVEKVEDGSRLVNAAGKTMNDIVVSVRRVNSIMSEIATASAEQSNGIEQVNLAIAQMDEVTQQNAALVEQAAAAAESLEEQAASLAEAVAQFRLDGGSGSRNSAVKPLKLSASKPAVHLKASAKISAISTSNLKEDDWREF